MVTVTVSNLDVDIPAADLLAGVTFGILDVEQMVKDKVAPIIAKLALRFVVGTTCPTITLGTSGNVYFGL